MTFIQKSARLVSSVKMSVFILFLLVAPRAMAQPDYKDVVYAQADGKDMKLDIYLPSGVTNPPLIVWVHGGAWQFGSKEKVPVIFREKGFAIASLDFRQSTDAKFPAGIYDIKGAIRFLKASAKKFGYRKERMAIGGDSSGGHLAALVGVTSGLAALEGTSGNFPGESSRVDAILDYYGASDLQTILSQSTPHGLKVRVPALQLLLGASPEEAGELARLASPVTHVDANDPPLLLIHGDQDKQMPINQSHELDGKYNALKLDVEFLVVHGAGHGGEVFFSGAALDTALAFLHRTIGKP